MRIAIAVALIAAGGPAFAGDEWQLVWVTRGAGWEINKGHGTLKRNGDVLEGVLLANDDGKADYQLRIDVAGSKASATFRVVSENDQAAKLSGTYVRHANSAQDCPEQIQLIDDHEYLGLARNACGR